LMRAQKLFTVLFIKNLPIRLCCQMESLQQMQMTIYILELLITRWDFGGRTRVLPLSPPIGVLKTPVQTERKGLLL